ncbi:MAG: hypothetical protein IJ600_07765 [Lachnospiraceae bacterium]|nr:hypothetical protein [Lachnospiraceae bacterium]
MIDPFSFMGYGNHFGTVASALNGYGSGTSLRPALPGNGDETAIGKTAPSDRDVQTGTDDPIARSSGKKECQTCKNRKYVDGSDEQVSFKSAARINPNAVESRVRAHEQEHVVNAYDKAEQNGGKVLQASVTLKYAICPECGRSYCAGGLTSTKIAYKEDNPYGKNNKSLGKEAATGNHIDAAV